MRLIDADALIEEVNKKKVVGRFNTLLLIDNAPTITISHELIEKLVLCVVDTVENIDLDKAIEAYKSRPHGKWIGGCKCSVCGNFSNDNGDFCTNCGADMRGNE